MHVQQSLMNEDEIVFLSLIAIDCAYVLPTHDNNLRFAPKPREKHP
jgi:hypothetical protein